MGDVAVRERNQVDPVFVDELDKPFFRVYAEVFVAKDLSMVYTWASY